MRNSVKTPCIGVCSTGIGDTVCRGCKRFAHEVIDWNRYTPAEKGAINHRLEQLMQVVVHAKIHIFDEVTLREQMRYQQIAVAPGASAPRCVYELLRLGATRIEQPDTFGFRLQPDWQHCSLTAIRQCLDQDFYTLSCAHYERYMACGLGEM